MLIKVLIKYIYQTTENILVKRFYLWWHCIGLRWYESFQNNMVILTNKQTKCSLMDIMYCWWRKEYNNNSILYDLFHKTVPCILGLEYHTFKCEWFYKFCICRHFVMRQTFCRFWSKRVTKALFMVLSSWPICWKFSHSVDLSAHPMKMNNDDWF